MKKSSRALPFRLPEAAYEELDKLSRKLGKPKALIVREALDAYLRAHGVEADFEVSWGGARGADEGEN